MARSAPCPLGQGPGSGVSRLPDSAEVNFVVVRNTPLIPAAARFMTSCPVAADSPLKKGARQNKRVWGGGRRSKITPQRDARTGCVWPVLKCPGFCSHSECQEPTTISSAQLHCISTASPSPPSSLPHNHHCRQLHLPPTQSAFVASWDVPHHLMTEEETVKVQFTGGSAQCAGIP